MNSIIALVKDEIVSRLETVFHYAYKLGSNYLDLTKTGIYEGHLWHQINKIIYSNDFDKNGFDLDTINKSGPAELSERIVEIPWVISHINKNKGTVLDAGSSLNFRSTLNHGKLRNKNTVIYNLNPERNCYWNDSVSYIYSDLRKIPFKSSSFDTITCISVLEHVGMNNQRYTQDEIHKEDNRDDYITVIRELNRVLKVGGKLLLTIPVGKKANLGWIQIFDYDMVQNIVDNFSIHSVDLFQFKRTWIKKRYSRNSINSTQNLSVRKASQINQVACIALTK